MRRIRHSIMYFRTKRLVRYFEQGRWSKFLSRQQRRDWVRYSNRAFNTPHCEQVVMRVSMHDEKRKWYLWLVYSFCEQGRQPHMHLQKLFVPSGDDECFTTPEELMSVPYFEAEI